MSTTQDSRKKMTIAKAQENLYSYNVARQVCEVNTKDMGTIYNPYTNLPGVTDGAVSSESYVIGTQVTAADSLQVNRRADASEHVNSYDWKSVSFGLIADRGMNYGLAISQTIDRSVLAFAVGNVTTALDDGDFGGTAGNAKTSSNTVIDDIINLGIMTVDALDGHGKKKFIVVSPYEANDLRGFMQNNGHDVADSAIRNGIAFVGTTFSGVDVYQTNNLRNTAALELATQPTANDSITINGVVFQFVASIGNPGDIHIGTAVDNTRANLAAALNAPGTAIAEATETGYTVVSTEDQDKLSRISLTASNNDTTDDLTITSNGTLILSETLTDATDVWAPVERQLVGGNYGSMYLALPTQGMDYHEKEVSGKAGVELFMEQFYNRTIWTRKGDQLFTVKVN
jgi:archaellum component FlaF (FlaF/FlaG flagellin family)